ncbi:hypothetical protein [Corynebacterium crudilactis]|uniref:hypothetical protein n=1 Tax=Corynebacterium crudilactis TaxID=1652495 RepID=UPI001470FCB0|nr:hypothetical protein [Corynebacterium crudilactis]
MRQQPIQGTPNARKCRVLIYAFSFIVPACKLCSGFNALASVLEMLANVNAETASMPTKVVEFFDFFIQTPAFLPLLTHSV